MKSATPTAVGMAARVPVVSSWHTMIGEHSAEGLVTKFPPLVGTCGMFIYVGEWRGGTSVPSTTHMLIMLMLHAILTLKPKSDVFSATIFVYAVLLE